MDGYIARHYNQRSELGAILDPLADKLLLVSGIILFTFDNAPYFGSIPLWLTGTIIGRDLLFGRIGRHSNHVGKVKVRPRILGKIATVLQMISIIWILLQWDANFRPSGFGSGPSAPPSAPASPDCFTSGTARNNSPHTLHSSASSEDTSETRLMIETDRLRLSLVLYLNANPCSNSNSN